MGHYRVVPTGGEGDFLMRVFVEKNWKSDVDMGGHGQERIKEDRRRVGRAGRYLGIAEVDDDSKVSGLETGEEDLLTTGSC